MSRRHEPAPPGLPEPGELPVEPDRGALPVPGHHDTEEEADEAPQALPAA